MSKLKYIKIILVLLLKAYLIYLWVNFVGAFTHLLYYIYILKVFSLEDFGLFLFFLFGNICCILWLVLWCKRLPPAFNKPKIYYEIKDWIRSQKEEAPIYKVLFGSLLLLLKLCLVVYILITAFISLFIYLYNMVFIVSYISLLYNRLRIVRQGWASLRFEGRVAYEWV